MNNTILIEGLDLAGKTSTCRTLVAEYAPRLNLRRNALTDSNPVYVVADRLRREGALPGAYLGHLFVAALAMDLKHYAPPGRPTIQESTIGLRSYCHYAARGEEGMAQAFAGLLDDPAHPRFACCVVLTAGLAARRARLEMRRRDAPEEIADDDLAVISAPETFLQMDAMLIAEARRRYGAVVIDTSCMTPSEVIMAVKDVIGGSLPADGVTPKAGC
ncbi:hypothetical protein [Falsiroseomonas sp. E2-1-a20]|uniref:hypothetical protein n=1 Tax=Falsiroseomonas sp. E2-1-a20 TaxID=3239300 RepID=UPI003F2DA898